MNQISEELKIIDDFKSCYITVENLKIHYVIGGAGPVILLIHGWPFTWLEWKNLMPILSENNFTVVAIDLPGCGESDMPDKPKSKKDIASMINYIIKSNNWEDITILGTDIGMMVAYALAANFPEKIKNVILGEGALPGFGLEELMDPSKGGSWHFGFQMQGEFAANVIKNNEITYHSAFWKIMSIKGEDKNFINQFSSYYGNKEGTLGGFYHYSTLLEDANFNKNNPNKKLKMPVLVLNGEKGIPQFITENSIHHISENYETAIISDCWHTIGEDNPSETAKYIIDFIKK